MAAPAKQFRWSWRSAAFRGVVYQIVAVAAGRGGRLVPRPQHAPQHAGARDPERVRLPASSPPASRSARACGSSTRRTPTLKAYLTGLSNTLRVAILGIIFATITGTLVGIGRLSKNFLVRSLCTAYVEMFRNVPLLLQLFIWYFIFTEFLPPIDEALQPLPGCFFSKNGLQYPIPVWASGHYGVLAGIVLGIFAAWGWAKFARRRFEATGKAPPVFLPALGLIVGVALLGWLAGGAPTALDIPEKTEITVVGGGAVTPEFLTVLIGLTLYTASYIAEIVRGGIQAVAYGQHEAAAALGLNRMQEVRLILLPQALRVIIPPITSQYLNLTKNSSLAVAVGYPDLVSISTTTLNQTGRAIEAISLVMLAYLTMSLLTALIMNLYNRRSQIRER